MLRWLWLSLAVVVLDQASKWIAVSELEAYRPEALTSWLYMTLMYNEGSAFSFLASAGGWQRWLFAGFAFIVTGALIEWIRRLKSDERVLAMALAMIVGGAIGNLIDRVVAGAVVDFIQVYLRFIPLDIFNPWPAFNLADSAIFVGVGLLILGSFTSEHEAGTTTSA